jgi:threonine/homoserine/homoserine lactone efflux protein
VIVNLPAYLVLAALVIISPGQDTALTIRNTLVGGRAGGIATAAGVVSGLATWTIATSAGLAVVIAASAPLFTLIRIIGAAYLVYLGIRALASALRRHQSPLELDAKGSDQRLKPPAAYRQGLISNLSNPKIIAFFPSLLPQFVEGHSSFFALLLLGVLFCAMTFAWLSGYAFVVQRAGDLLRRGPVRRVMEAISGTVLVGLGLRLATEQR